jgi:hypothetical protein
MKASEKSVAGSLKYSYNQGRIGIHDKPTREDVSNALHHTGGKLLVDLKPDGKTTSTTWMVCSVQHK